MHTVSAPAGHLVSIVYVSSATGELTDEQITGMLRLAKSNNERLGVTGMLLHRDGHFLQVLEGPVEVVDDLLKKIRADSRHQDIILMARKNIEGRLFGDWPMAFRDMSKSPSYAHAFHAILESDTADDETDEGSKLAYRLLLQFRATEDAQPAASAFANE